TRKSGVQHARHGLTLHAESGLPPPLPFDRAGRRRRQSSASPGFQRLVHSIDYRMDIAHHADALSQQGAFALILTINRSQPPKLRTDINVWVLFRSWIFYFRSRLLALVSEEYTHPVVWLAEDGMQLRYCLSRLIIVYITLIIETIYILRALWFSGRSVYEPQ